MSFGDTQKQALDSYVERLLALKSAEDDDLDAAELREIALELGLSEEDLENADAAASKYLKRGQGFAEHDRWDDAIAELTNAMALQPQRPEVLFALADAHAERWRVQRRSADRSAADRF